MGGNNMWRVVAVLTALLLPGQHATAARGPSALAQGPLRNVFTRNMRDFSVADQGRFWGGSLGWGDPFSMPRTARPPWSGMVLGLGKRSGGSLYQGAPSLEDTGMLMGMGKRGAPMEPSRNPRWNRHHRIQRKDPLQKAFEIRREDLDAMEEEEGEMVRLVEKRSGLTLPTPNVEDAGMLMGMGKRSPASKRFALGGLPNSGTLI